MDNLAKDAFLARQNRLSYGQHMAKYGTCTPNRTVPDKKVCPQCGVEIEPKKGSRRRYCSDNCRNVWHSKRRYGNG